MWLLSSQGLSLSAETQKWHSRSCQVGWEFCRLGRAALLHHSSWSWMGASPSLWGFPCCSPCWNIFSPRLSGSCFLAYCYYKTFMFHGRWSTAQLVLLVYFFFLTKVDQQAVVQSQAALAWDISFIPHFFKAYERRKKKSLGEKYFHSHKICQFYSIFGTYFVMAKVGCPKHL